MVKIDYKASSLTPKVFLDEENGIFALEGKSSPEDSFSFYSSILDGVKNLSLPKNELTANFNLVYFNTSSSRCLFVLMRELKTLNTKGHTININWHYEENDDDIKEVGEDFAELLDWKFNYILIEE